jgi:uncharacterized membrane protein YccC
MTVSVAMTDPSAQDADPSPKPGAAESTRPQPAAAAPLAGGFLIAFGAVSGAVIGIFLGQPSAGAAIGLGLGCLAAVAMVFIRPKRKRS